MDIALVVRNWLFGWYIVESSQYLVEQYFTENSSISGKELLSSCSSESAIQDFWQTLSAKFSLSWSHYVVLLTIKSEEERRFYEIESLQRNWDADQERK